ncbi:peptidase, ArgE/DapE family protein [Aspergillus niger]|uniref:Peptidase, ArgE/DapE family protein n=1 Tax=Aspergillus niger TaxID=5061 RepID=A0A505IA07_ASPNG|nr:peptidase, ArgE/DapE family protein [Aspergillus niger]
METHPHPPYKHPITFWLVFLSLCLLSFVSALDGAIISTALPKVTTSLGGETDYIWIANSFTIAQTIIQPFLAQLCDIYGRRNPILISVALFLLGSGLAGGASTVGQLIGGRTVQGLGSGGIYILVDLIVCDLVPQRERGQYLGIVLSLAAVGAVLGPVLGGALAQANWRWVFYLNLPLAGPVLLFMLFFLRLDVPQPSSSPSLLRIDWPGNILFAGCILSQLLALRKSPLTSGIDLLPCSAFLIPFAMVAGTIMSRTGLCRPLHFIGFAALSLALGLFTPLSAHSPRAAWVCVQLPAALGQGFLATTILPAIQSSLGPNDIASSTGVYAFLRSLAFVWGSTAPGIVFNARVDVYARRITTDEKLRERLLDGRAYGAAAEFAGSWGAGLDVVQREQVREVYRLALRTGGLEENGYGLKEKGDEKVVDGREGSNRVEEVFHAVETGKREETGGRA